MKNRTLVIIVSIFAVLLLVFAGAFAIQSKSYTEYKLSPDSCMFVFSCNPDEFMQLELDFYTPFTDLRRRASIDKQGNLILKLNEDQKIAWRQSYMVDGFLEQVSELENISISPDYTKVTINCYKETVISDFMATTYIYYGMSVYQLLNGIQPEDLAIEVVFKDGGTGEIIFTQLLPVEEDVSIPFSEFEISSLYDD